MGGGVIKCPPSSARNQPQLYSYIYSSTCRWRWALDDSTAMATPATAGREQQLRGRVAAVELHLQDRVRRLRPPELCIVFVA
jgi:hypothetical protein